MVVAVSSDDRHRFSKSARSRIRLVAGSGVEGDAHYGTTVQHRSRVARDPTQPNLRQVHLLHAELFDELRAIGFEIAPGQLGENVTTRHLDLLGMPTNTRLHIGEGVVLQVTGLRNPCAQIDGFRDGLMKAVLGRDADGNVVRKAGVMSIVVVGGDVGPGDVISVELPVLPHIPLAPV